MSEPSDPSDPIAVLGVSQPRRYIAVAMLTALGVLLLWLGLSHPPSTMILRLYLLAMGTLMLFGATRLWSATERHLVLTGAGLFDSAGRQVCAMDNIRAVERGFLAFKPSNGFLIRLHRSAGRGWAPGMWWRMGTRVGVGGVTSAAEARLMSELLALHLAGEDLSAFRPPTRPR